MSSKAASTKKKSTTGKASAARKARAAGTTNARTVAASKLDELNREAEAKPKLIRPMYLMFDVPSGEQVIIKKIPVGPRDGISEASAIEGTDKVDMGVFAHHVIANSIVYPEITFDQVNDIDEKDFPEIFEQAYQLSYRNGGEVVKAFPTKSNT